MRLLKLTLLAFVSFAASAQISLGIHAEPSANLSLIEDIPDQLDDSLRNLTQADGEVNFHIELRKAFDRFHSLSIEPGFFQVKTKHTQEDLQFLDVIHPQLPVISDLTYAAQRNAYLHYRYQYFRLGVRYNYRPKKLYKNNGIRAELGAGLSYLYLLNHDVKVRTEGFSVDNSSFQYVKDSTGHDARAHQINFTANFDINYEIAPTYDFVAGIQVQLPMTSAASSRPNVTILSGGLHVGLRKEF